MGECRSKAFGSFIKNKESELDDLVMVVDYCAHKVPFLREFFFSKFVREGGIELTEASCDGLTRILEEIEDDLHLISDEMMADVEQ